MIELYKVQLFLGCDAKELMSIIDFGTFIIDRFKINE